MSKIDETVDSGLCVECGLCTAVCPKNCIVLKDRGTPEIHEGCIACGLCAEICPGQPFDYKAVYEKEKLSPETDFWAGAFRSCYRLVHKDAALLKNSTSGGAVSGMVKKLLEKGSYDAAFLVEDNRFDKRAGVGLHKTVAAIVEKAVIDRVEKTAKSRYIPVSQAAAAEYMLKNREAKLILVGTACAIHGFLNIIDRFKLCRENYLLLGLFCDSCMGYEVYDYFCQHPKVKGQIEEFYFRDKAKKGWPGDMRIVCEGGRVLNLDRSARMEVKEHFKMERCLYCLDKLNQFADISFGDDYSSSKRDFKGASAVIVRSEAGTAAFEACKEEFEVRVASIEDIVRTQHLNKRRDNYYYGRLKGLSVALPPIAEELKEETSAYEKAYRSKLAKLKSARKMSYSEIQRSISVKKKLLDRLKKLKSDVLYVIYGSKGH